MSNMPELNVSFSSKARTSIERSDRGSIFMVLRGDVPVSLTNPLLIQTEDDIPATLSSDNKTYIKFALKGNDTAPKKVVCFMIAEDEEEEGAVTLSDALGYAALNRFDYFVMPTVETDGAVNTVKAWIIAQKEQNNLIKAVLPNCAADSEYIINFTTTKVYIGSDEYTAEQFTPRIAGIICGTPLDHSVTYATIPEATDCTRLTKAEMETAAGAGKLFAFWDGEKVKLSRGINSLTTLTTSKNTEFQKIKHVEVMNLITDDIKRVAQDSYIGKFGNSYSNRCLLLSAISVYFSAYEADGIIDGFTIAFDLEKIKSEMRNAGIDFSDKTDDEIIKYDFGTGVYIAAYIKLRDAVEDIIISITV